MGTGNTFNEQITDNQSNLTKCKKVIVSRSTMEKTKLKFWQMKYKEWDWQPLLKNDQDMSHQKI